MHLSLDAPDIWYLVGLHAPGLDVVGMSIPGAPGVVAGRTRGVAWDFTNAYVDDEDFFVERLDPADSTRDGPGQHRGRARDRSLRLHRPFEDHPHVLDPSAGFVVAANNRQTRNGVADRISSGIWGDPYRGSDPGIR